MRLRPLPPAALRQKPSARMFRLANDPRRPTRYIPLIGTMEWDAPWASDPQSHFQQALRAHDFEMILDERGRPFRWYAALAGLYPQDTRAFEYGADAVYHFSEDLPFEDRNYIVYSNAGQVMWLLGASRFPIRSVTFVGTPNRNDVPSDKGLQYIRMPQLIFDAHFDLIAWIGAMFDGKLSLDRSFKQLGPALLRYPTPGIGHGGVLHEPEHIALWSTQPWLDNIRAGRAKEAV